MIAEEAHAVRDGAFSDGWADATVEALPKAIGLRYFKARSKKPEACKTLLQDCRRGVVHKLYLDGLHRGLEETGFHATGKEATGKISEWGTTAFAGSTKMFERGESQSAPRSREQ